MVDVVDKATRSRMMSGIRGKNTHPEIFVRKGLHATGFRFRLHAKNIPGRPDIVLPKYRALISVRGCFWHGHDCRYFKVPSTRTEFWLAKIESNRSRDMRDVARQQEDGWRTLVIWECAVRAGRRVDPLLDVIGLTIDWLRSVSAHAEMSENGMVGD
ncbi:DNA mismatch endonuclease Vsr [Uliginosibacterium sp. H3]|uniref:DNA mismatch endonuclease Vsr n=1 Tax=Uliginosibacterium silvisoli TaxID=3114758 RepID=A0ABU6JYD4_9RHOO|nr:DNA mismatch endonuclease Vsr [Uliginosibacterium sp. H3]